MRCIRIAVKLSFDFLLHSSSHITHCNMSNQHNHQKANSISDHEHQSIPLEETPSNSYEDEIPTDIQDIVPNISISYKNFGRRILSRKNSSTVNIVNTLNPGQTTDGCLTCCSAPTCCPLLSICPCCGDAEYIRQKKKSSSYIYIRENSLEWNDPEIVIQPGVCCGIDPCLYDIQDKVQVVYFDDVVFDRLTDQTRYCNECRTCCFGGKGERIRMDAPTCFGCCQRGSSPCICIPFCCPKSLCPCILRFEIYVDDAQKGLYEIKKAREAALRKDLYNDNPNKKY